MKNGNDPVIDAALAEVLGGAAAPDLSARILARAQAQAVQQPQAVDGHSSPWRSRMFMAVEFLAAAAVLGVIAWLVWFSETTPATNMRANVEAPSFVSGAPDAEFELKDGEVRFRRGWLMVETGVSIIRAADTTISNVAGRAILKDGAAPTAAEVELVRPWLKDNRVEEEMLTNAKRWLVRGAVALFVLSGSVMVDGVKVIAEEDSPEPPQPMEERVKEVVHTPADVEKLDEGITDLVCAGFKDEDVKLLLRFKRLRNLDIRSVYIDPPPASANQLTDIGVNTLAQVTSLRVINLSRNWAITGAGFAKLASMPRLEALNLAYTNVTGSMISSLSASKTLRELDLEDSQYSGDNVAEDFKALADYPALRSLGLVRCDWVNDAVLKCVGNCKRLVDLNMDHSLNFGDEGVRALAGLESLTDLRVGGMFTERAHPAPGSKPRPSVSTYLVTSSQAWAEALGKLSRLKLLHLDTVKGIDDSVLTALGGGPNRTPGTPLLRELRMPKCTNITDAGIAELRRLPLRTIEVSYCGRLTDAALTSMAEMTSLEQLVLYSANQVMSTGDPDDPDAWLGEAILDITDKGLAALATAKNLSYLDISCSQRLTATGLKALSGLTNLRYLNMSRNASVTDASIADVISTLNSLRHLDISYCKGVTDAAVDDLGKLVDLEQLVIARGHNVPMFTDEAREKLRKLLPETTITAQR